MKPSGHNSGSPGLLPAQDKVTVYWLVHWKESLADQSKHQLYGDNVTAHQILNAASNTFSNYKVGIQQVKAAKNMVLLCMQSPAINTGYIVDSQTQQTNHK